MKRIVAIALALIALLLVIVGGVVVLVFEPDGPPARGSVGDDRDPQSTRQHAEPDAGPTRRVAGPDVTPELAPVVHEPVELPARRPLPPGTGFVVGTVIDLRSGDALQSVEVTLLHPTGERVATASTDHAGRYQIDAVPENTPFVLRVTHPGHLLGYCSDVRVGAHSIVRKDMTLLRAPEVRVTVTSQPFQQAATDVPVRVMDGGRRVAEGRTDEFGELVLSVPEMGRFDLRVAGEAWAPPPAMELALLPGARDAHRAVDVWRGGSLAVEAYRDGEPAGGASITCAATGLLPVRGVTDSDGRVALGPFPPAHSLTVIATDASGAAARRIVSVRDAHATPVRLDLRPSGVVRGRVESASRDAVAGARVVIPLGPGLDPIVAVTDTEGGFAVAGVPDGDVDVSIEVPGREAELYDLDAAVRGNAVLRLERTLHATVEGRLNARDGARVDDVRVRLEPSGVTTTSDENGVFRLTGVPVAEPQIITLAAADVRLDDQSRRASIVKGLEDGDVHSVVLLVAAAETELEAHEFAHVPELTRAAGRLLSDVGAPVPEASVVWGNSVVITDAEGLFEIDRAVGDTPPAALRVQPPEGLLEDRSIELSGPDAAGAVGRPAVGRPAVGRAAVGRAAVGRAAVELGDVTLRTRPTALVHLARAPAGDESAQTFSLLLDGHSQFLGAATPAYEGATRVTYDGTWMHVEPQGAWWTAGRRRAWVGVLGPWGPLVADAEWPVVPGPAQSGRPDWTVYATKARLKLSGKVIPAKARLTWERPPSGALVKRLGLPVETTFRLAPSQVNTLLSPIGKGRWTLLVQPESGRSAVELEISDGRVRRVQRR